ncbi:hypothetical protein ACO1O0_005380 [Amphichorda felina]
MLSLSQIQATSLARRSQTDYIAAAVVGTTVAVGVLILVLLFLAIHLYKRKLVQLGRPSGAETAKKPSGRVHRGGRASFSSLRVDFGHKEEEVEPPSSNTEGLLSRMRKSTVSLARIFHARTGTTKAGSAPTSQATERRTESAWGSSIEAPALSTDFRAPETPEAEAPRGSHNPPDALWRPPVPLPRLKTQPMELCGSDEGMRNTSTAAPVPMRIKPGDPSRWSMSTLGRQLLRDTMCDPDPAQFEPSPETPMVQSAKRMVSPLQGCDLTTPVMPRYYHSGIAGFETQIPSPPSPHVKGDWTIEEDREWTGRRPGGMI